MLLDGLEDWLRRKGFATPEEFRGLLAVPVGVDQSAYERAGYVEALEKARRTYGDLTTALATLEALPPAGKDALGPWRDRAERRARIDRNIAEVRAQALKDLTDLARSGG